MKAQQWVLAAYQYHFPTKQGVRAGRCITLHSECKQYQRESIELFHLWTSGKAMPHLLGHHINWSHTKRQIFGESTTLFHDLPPLNQNLGHNPCLRCS